MPKISPEKLEAMRSISVMTNGLPSKPKVREFRTEAGRVKQTTDGRHQVRSVTWPSASPPPPR